MNTTPNYISRKPTHKKPSPQKGKPNAMLPLVVITLFVILTGSRFWERFRNDPNLDREAVEAAQREAEEIVDRHAVWVQYVLVANTTMKRPCLNCPGGITMVTVRAGEVYKYGITTQGESRYSRSIYDQLGLNYYEEYEGSYIECKEMEINKITSYLFLPESKKPEVKLIRSPGNANRS